ncbi:hypothetical protein [Anaerococcus hydrogenalis]|uniref:Uncharacterized protein n=1 Tax=Anaerococcus hydrogenalis ACS-025-V-Sch4 TaxID=879306 RepID=F0H1Q7_9FIRM|nr:hypothetical protein [Anaerococcus hydrogenalis]EGC83613.1 hypothetical protein HMPREF9246_1261 [Anaerococcus hydrogenalis ACS-025-V-Sch4]
MPVIIKYLIFMILVSDFCYFGFKRFGKIKLDFSRFDFGLIFGQVSVLAFVGIIVYRFFG